MFHSKLNSGLVSGRFKYSRRAVLFLLLCAFCAGLWAWPRRQYAEQAAIASANLQPTLRRQQEVDLHQAFKPQSFVEMTDGVRWAALFGAPVFNTIIVNTTADDAVVNSNCTLREAIMAANTNTAVDACQPGATGLDMIVFNIGAGTPTINLTSALPTITESVTINGNTNGATRVELNGAGAGAGANGLDITAGGSTISSLVINRFTSNGIHIQTNGGNTIQNSLIGVDAAGTAAQANSGAGVRIDFAANNLIGGTTAGAGNVISGNGTINVFISGANASGNQVLGNLIGLNAAGTAAIGGTTDGVGIDGAPGNTIGGTTNGARNIISGHTRFGVNIFGATATGNVVQSNFIGLNSAGTAAIANASAGVAVSDTTGTVIGGTAAGAGNVISGNASIGIDLFSGTGTQIQGNLIGTNPTGTAAIGNGFDGINIRASAANTIGGTSATARNLISGNGQFGINDLGLGSGGNTIQGNYVGVNISGTAAIASSSGGVVLASPNNLLGGTASGAGNLISGNSQVGVLISGAAATGNRVQGNYIGLNATGTMKIANSGFGVFITAASNNLIGGTASGAGNVISGNDGSGVAIDGTATGNQVQGNLIGTNAAGTTAIGNMAAGVDMNASNNIIGGTVAGARNIISGNGSDQSGGVALSDGAAGNQILGNFIGTDITGTMDVGNSLFGVRIFNAANGNTLGGTTAGARNVISGNNNDGVQLQNATTVNNLVQGNYIGLNAAGTAALPNDLSGVNISGANNNTVGGTASGAGNVISGNGLNGVTFVNSASGNQAQGNLIGTNAAGTGALGNTGLGVSGESSGNTVGGAAAGAGNTIAFNNSAGVAVLTTVVNFRISDNAIFSNQGLGIDLLPAGVTPNDAGDPDTGANNLQNFPILISITSTGAVSGSLDSTPANSAYPVRIEFFGNTACDPSGNGEGEVFLGSTTVSAPGSFTASVTLVPGKSLITATATDNNGNTSEFSACQQAGIPPTITAAAPPARQQGSPPINSQIATVTDPDQAPNTLMVQVNSAPSATVNGVTVSNLTINGAGQVFADIVASCTATNASFTLTVTDNQGAMATATLNVTVTANTPPTLSYASPQSVLVGQALTVNPATGPSDNGSIASIIVQSAGTYTGMISVDSAGVVTLSNAKPVGSHTIAIQATDNCGLSTISLFTLNVNCQAITVTPPATNTGTAGTPFSQTFTQSGGIGATTFSTASALPTGLALASNGVLSGTPMQAGTFPITVKATDSNGCMGTANYTLTINCPAITVNPPSLPNGTAGTAYSQTISAAGGTAPYSFAVTSGALPTGITLAPGGNLSGLPSQSGTFNFTITATDANGCTGNRAYALVIACPPFAIIMNAPSAVSAGQNLSYDVTVMNPCPDVALNTTLTTNTPANTTFQSITAPAGWTCTTPVAGGTGAISCNNPNFLAGATTPFTIVLRVNPGTPIGTVITNTVTVTGTAPGRPPVTATASSNTTVANNADLSISKTAPATAVAGTNTTFNIAVTNNGPSPATTVTLTDVVPANTTFQTFTFPAGWVCTTPAVGGTGTITCNTATLAANATANFALTVKLDPNVACDTTISNTASAQSALADPTPDNNTATATLLAKSQSDLAVNVIAPATATPDTSVVYTVTVNNNGPSNSFNTVLNNALPAAFFAEAVTTSAGTCTGIGTNSVNCNLGTLATGAAATVTIQAHVPETCQPTTAVFNATVASGNCLADPVAANNSQSKTTMVLLGNVGPGACVPAASATSADKPGSILFASLALSGATAAGSGDSNQNNTRMNLTNVHPTLGVVVHLFFIDGATCSVADSFLCLTANQTTSFLMSDIDPGTMGYMMMIAVDGPPGFAGGHNTGCPISFNYLIGNANIKLTASPRRDADLGSESVPAQFGSPAPACVPNSSVAELHFDGSPTGYNRLPQVLALDSFGSRADGNDTLLFLGRIDGNWATGLEPIGPVFGLLYNDMETAASFSFNVGSCLFRQSLSNNFPRISPRFDQFIPAGRTGWLKLWAMNGAALVGAALTRNDNAQTSANAFEGGHNLHILRLLPSAVITVPVFPPSC